MKYDNLSVRLIKYILTLAEEENFTKASEKLFITQPSLSQAIRRFEQETGIILFTRKKAGIELTREGKMLVDAGKHILNILFELDKSIADKNIIIKDEITIGTGYTLGTVFLYKLLANFRKKYPEIQIHFVEAKSRELERLTLEGEIDISFVLLPLSTVNLQKRVMTSGNMALAMSKNNPLNEYAFCREDNHKIWYFDLRRAYSANFIMPIEGNRTEEIACHVFKKLEITPHVSIRFRNIPTAIKLVEESNDLLLLPDVYLLSMYNGGQKTSGNINCYRIAPGLEDDYQWELVAAYQQDATQLSSATRKLIDLIENDEFFDESLFKKKIDSIVK